MYIKKLTLTNFKNHQLSSFQFSELVNCFVGDNGSGKTNILDAIHYLSLTKSYFNKSDTDNIKFNEEYFIVKGDIYKGGEQFIIQCSLYNGQNKIIKYNGKKYKRFSDHIGEFPVVIISPTDINIILDGSEIRRRYLDSIISQYDIKYLRNLIDYKKVLKQRNRLLKDFNERQYFDKVSLDVYDDQLINIGTYIFDKRQEHINLIINLFKEFYKNISDGTEQVNIKYLSDLQTNEFSNVLENSLEKDRRTQYTNVGIHKDDIIFEMNSNPIKKFGSQGQQKSFLIALKLAKFHFLESQIGFKPILLLDDIFDKLDEKRVKSLLSYAKNGSFGQVFITDTNEKRTKNILSSSKIQSNIFNLDKGKVIK